MSIFHSFAKRYSFVCFLVVMHLNVVKNLQVVTYSSKTVLNVSDLLTSSNLEVSTMYPKKL